MERSKGEQEDFCDHEIGEQMNEPAKPLRPNILWICTDHQRWDTIRTLGNAHINTPNHDRLCSEGIAFTRAYCQCPICTPSRSSFLTGLYPSTIHGNVNGNEYFEGADRFPLITKLLADSGYDCGLSGKLHIASAWKGQEKRVDDGYRVFDYSHSHAQGRGVGNQYLDWLEEQGVFDEVFEGHQIETGGNPLGGKARRRYSMRRSCPARYHQTTWCADRAIDFMRSAASRHPSERRPWLFSVNIFDPHSAYAPLDYENRYDPSQLPPPLFRETDLAAQERLRSHVYQNYSGEPGEREQRFKATFYGMIELIDENIGRMLDALEETEQRENTLVIATSDHGDSLGDHGLSAKGCRFYEGLVHVPLILSWPGQLQQGLQADCLAELNDIAPTLGELAGVELPMTQGLSLLPIATGAADPNRLHDYVRSEFYDTLDMDFPKGDPDRPPSYATMYRDERYKLVVYHGNEYGELYDLDEDPNEFENLWERSDHALIKSDLLKRSFDATVQATDPGPRRIGRY